MTTSVTSKFFLNKDSFSKKVRRYNKTEPKIIYKRAQKKLRQLAEFYQKAEAGGFEPPVRLPVRQFSKLLVSATHPNFQSSLGTHLLSNAVQI